MSWMHDAILLICLSSATKIFIIYDKVFTLGMPKHAQ